MNIVLDLIVLLIVVLLVIGGYKRGVIKTVVELGGTLLSSLAASLGGSVLAVNLYDSFIKQHIIDAVSSSLPEITPLTKTVEITEELVKNAPSYITNAFELMGYDINSITNDIDNSASNIPVMVESMIRPVMIKLFTVVITIVLFAVFATVIALVSKSITSVVQMAGLSGVNRFFGAVVGLVEAVALILVMCMIIYILTVLRPTDAAQGLRDAVDSTFIFRFIADINLPEMIIDKIITV